MKANKIKKIIVFSSDLTYSSVMSVIEMQRLYENIEWLIVLHQPSRSICDLLINQKKLLKKHGWRLLKYRAEVLIGKLFRLFNFSKTREANASIARYNREELLSKVKYIKVEDINSTSTEKEINEFQPDLGISLGAPILKNNIFEIPAYGSVNIHKGKLPEYKGMPPAFWELWNNEDSVGCTVHMVRQGLDEGEIILESHVDIHEKSTLSGLRILLDELGVDLMKQALIQIENESVSERKQVSGGNTNSKPSLKQEALLQKKIKRENGERSMKEVIKSILFFAYIYIYRPIPRYFRALMGKQKIVILMYHRVNDLLRDNVTVGVEQFNQQMKYISEKHNVVSLDDIVDGRVDRRSLKTIVAVTFDDGYKDNHDIARPILIKNNVHATFFVSTGFIDKDKRFPHDVEKLDVVLPNMSWEDLRKMTEQGLSIGSHTINHINCAAVDNVTLTNELTLSKSVLENKLGLKEVLFAYPFGGKNNINDSALDEVRKSGYKACFSGYGGCITDDIDIFRIPRIGINYKYSMLSFIARLEGYV